MAETTSSESALKIAPVGHAISLFLVISYLLCVAFGLLAPENMHMHKAWAPLLPGFEWLTLRGFIFGLISAYFYGWYVAVVFVPLYRFFRHRA